MTEVEKQSLIEQLEDLKAQGDEYLQEIEYCKTKASTTKDKKQIKHIEERLGQLFQLLDDNTKKLTVVVKKLKKNK